MAGAQSLESRWLPSAETARTDCPYPQAEGSLHCTSMCFNFFFLLLGILYVAGCRLLGISHVRAGPVWEARGLCTALVVIVGKQVSTCVS